MPLQASEIVARQFRQILLWPLSLRNTDADGRPLPVGETCLGPVTTLLQRERWTWADAARETADLRETGWYDGEQDYSEITYFHSYVRDLLYGGDGTLAEKRPLRVFRRDDASELQVELGGELPFDVRLGIERVEFYLFLTGVAILVVELKAPDQADLTLDKVMNLQNAVRMAFPRRWNDRGEPSESPRSVSLLDRNGDTLVHQDYTRKEDFTQVVRDRAELPAAGHLAYWLKPLGLYGTARGGYCVHPVEDQRLASLTYIAVDNPRDISDWDYARLTFFDDAGDSRVGSYSDDFLANWEARHAYDRFWQRAPSAGDGSAIDDHNKMMQTRWLCSGYGFVVVGQQGSKFFRERILANFRHHYFRMGLLAHFHRASLVALRDELATTTKGEDEGPFHDSVIAVKRKAIRFRSRFWFPEVSTQLQGQELFRWWSDLLGNQQFFDKVSADIDAAESLVRTEQERLENQHSEDLSQEANRLAGVATKAAGFGLALAFIGLLVAMLDLSWLHMGVADARLTAPAAWDVIWKGGLLLVGAFLATLALGSILVQVLKCYLRQRK